MLDLKYIDRVKWSDDLGKRLQTLRRKTSRRALVEKTTELGHPVAYQYIQQLEQPSVFARRIKSSHLTVSLDVVQVLCDALGAELTDIFAESVKIFTDTPLTSTAINSKIFLSQ